ncbi:hypothetical protein MNBD_DELTA02-1164 [hydrothermal vent metagenome]|uniref:NHL repeat domain protein n=1 Tax=hydrothermal vent metagenome TaxID=652676 RepID=A0A3B0UXU5_9ZZZZ
MFVFLDTFKGLCRLVAIVAVFVVLTCTFAASAFAAKADLITIAVLGGDELTGNMAEPAGLFVDEARKRLYVADTVNNRLISFDKDLTFIAALTHDNFKLPLSVGKLPSGKFFITDASDDTLKLIDVKDKLITPFNIKGLKAAVEKFMPGRFAMDDAGNLYIVDKLNKRIVVADKDGNYQRSITAKGKDFYGFNDVRVDGRGNVYAVDTVGASIYVFNDKGGLVTRFGGKAGEAGLVFPVSVAVNSKGLIYVADRYLSQIMVYNRFGALQFTLLSKGVIPGDIYHPSYIYIDKSDLIYIIDGARVQVFKEKR